MKKTGIQWCDDTVNPTSGCDGCELWVPGTGGPCYAGTMHTQRLCKVLPDNYSEDFQEVRLIPGRVAKAARCMSLDRLERPDKPWLNGRRRKIFVGDMGDIFSRAVPFPYLKQEIIDVARDRHGSRHDFLCLTKQPRRALQFARWLQEQGEDWPDNVWLGTSITGTASLSRIGWLAQHPSPIRFLSVEPLVEQVDLAPWLSRLQWVIVGGESTQGEYLGRPFHLEWARGILRDCREVGVPFFLKQLGSVVVPPLPLSGSHGDVWEQWPEDLRVRELPVELQVAAA